MFVRLLTSKRKPTKFKANNKKVSIKEDLKVTVVGPEFLVNVFFHFRFLQIVL